MKTKKRYCSYCNLYLKSGGLHIYTCVRNVDSKNKENIKFEYLKYNFPELGDKDFLYKKYVIEEKSLPELNEEYFIDYKSIGFLLKYFNIDIRNAKQSANLEKTRKKYIKTCLKKYGTENVLSKKTSGYIKKESTVQQKYGVKNVFQLNTVIEKIKDDSHYIKKYGLTRKQLLSKRSKETWSLLSDDEKTEWLCKSMHSDVANETRKQNKKGFLNSKLEYRIRDIFSKHNVNIEPNFTIKANRTKRRHYDIHIKETNILIEVNGDYWHANPEIYKKDDQLNYFGSFIKAQEVWDKDKYKKELAESKGYDVIYLWENEIKKMSDIELEQKIITFLKDKNISYENQINQ